MLRKNNYQEKDEIFRIIVEIKGVDDVGKLCEELKEIVKKKKINRNYPLTQRKSMPIYPGNSKT